MSPKEQRAPVEPGRRVAQKSFAEPLQRADSEEHCARFHSKGPPVSLTAEDSRDFLPRFPLDMLDADAVPSSASAGRRRRTHLELVTETSESNVLAAPATHDLFNDQDDESSVALTQIYVPSPKGTARDQESRGRFDEFWSSTPVSEPEPPPVYLPLFPRVPLLRRRTVLAALGAAVVFAVALAFGTFALLAYSSSGAEAEGPASEVK